MARVVKDPYKSICGLYEDNDKVSLDDKLWYQRNCTNCKYLDKGKCIKDQYCRPLIMFKDHLESCDMKCNRFIKRKKSEGYVECCLNCIYLMKVLSPKYKYRCSFYNAFKDFKSVMVVSPVNWSEVEVPDEDLPCGTLCKIDPSKGRECTNCKNYYKPKGCAAKEKRLRKK